MKCPFCAEENTKVIDSRPADDNNSIRRRRQCEKCGKRFTTYEKLETIPLVVIKKDQMRGRMTVQKLNAVYSDHVLSVQFRLTRLMNW